MSVGESRPLLVAVSHLWLSDALTQILRKASLETIAADNLAAVFAQVRLNPAAILVDPFAFNVPGLELLSQLRQEAPTTPIIVLIPTEACDYRDTVIRLGADGVVATDRAATDLLPTVKQLIDRTTVVHGSTDIRSPTRRTFSILAHVADSRRCVYGWLALGFDPPDAELVCALTTEQMVGEIETSTTWLEQDRDRLTDSLQALRNCTHLSLADLDQEYNRLFGNSIMRIATHEAVYRWCDARDLSPRSNFIVEILQQQYQQFNVTPDPGQEDHVAFELEFLSYLCGREAANWATGASEAARLLRRQQRSFLDDHLGRWLSEFCQLVLERRPVCFYGPLAALTDIWLNLEHGPGYLRAVRK